MIEGGYCMNSVVSVVSITLISQNGSSTEERYQWLEFPDGMLS